MKKRIGMLLVAVVMVTAMLSGCSFGPKPEETLTLFLDAAKEYDMKVMNSCVEDADWEGEEEDVLDDKNLQEFFKNTLSKMTYTLEKSEIDGDTAVVPAKIKYVDASDLIGDAMSEYMEEVVKSALSGKELTEEEYSSMLSKILADKSKDAKDKFSNVTIEFKCVKKDGDWFITDLDDEILNVISSNFYQFSKELDEDLGSLEDSLEDAADDSAVEDKDGTSDEGTDDTSDEGADIGAMDEE